MKRLFLLIATIACLPFMASAQFEDGSLFLSGSSSFAANYNTYQDSDYKYFSVGLSPTVGTVLVPGLVGGLRISPAYSRSENTDTYRRTISLSAVPFLRYYLSDGKVKPFIEAASGFGKNWTKGEQFMSAQGSDPVLQDYSSTANTFTARAGAGLGIFLTDNIAIDAGLFYNYEKNTPIDSPPYTTASKRNNLSMSLALSFFLG